MCLFFSWFRRRAHLWQWQWAGQTNFFTDLYSLNVTLMQGRIDNLFHDLHGDFFALFPASFDLLHFFLVFDKENLAFYIDLPQIRLVTATKREGKFQPLFIICSETHLFQI